METASLIIGDFSSTCSACGGNADPEEIAHIHGGLKSMYDRESSLSQENGCGAKFVEVIWDHWGDPPELVHEAYQRIADANL